MAPFLLAEASTRLRACVKDSNAEAINFQQKIWRGGAQTKLFDEKVLVEGEIPSASAIENRIDTSIRFCYHGFR